MIVLTAIIASGIAPAVYASATFYWTGRPPRQRHIRFPSSPQACIPSPPSNTRQSEGEILRLVVKTVTAVLRIGGERGGGEGWIPKPQESRSPKYAGNLSDALHRKKPRYVTGGEGGEKENRQDILDAAANLRVDFEPDLFPLSRLAHLVPSLKTRKWTYLARAHLLESLTNKHDTVLSGGSTVLPSGISFRIPQLVVYTDNTDESIIVKHIKRT